MLKSLTQTDLSKLAADGESMTGWIFVLAGIILIAMGSLSVYYGQDLLRRTSSQMVSTAPPGPILNPQQERLLSVIHGHQVRFGADRLVIGRDGRLHFDKPLRDDPTYRDLKINIAVEALGPGLEPAAQKREFELLMNGMPPEYLRHIPEMRMDSPFVVTITEVGIRYLRPK